MTHRFQCRVYYEDTDMGGIVYHANYLKFMERARSDWVRALGLDQRAMREAGTVFAVRRIAAEYLRPAHFDDLLDVETEVVSARPARMTLRQRVLRDGAALFDAEVELVAIGAAGRPVRLPEVLRALGG
ncbi:tol-pal system-associated acyl-CoA thioesterase [Rhodosalinus sp.]|uniref:tol-pal system-associated acyl-CoA thioesterase n=1 Tax=Rhodosalinus sp. TaxID=2047741 RepID=UPI003979A3CE